LLNLVSIHVKQNSKGATPFLVGVMITVAVIIIIIIIIIVTVVLIVIGIHFDVVHFDIVHFDIVLVIITILFHGFCLFVVFILRVISFCMLFYFAN